MAPIIPFMCEHIYQNLVRSVENNAKLSIFMDGFADVSFDINDEDVLYNTQIARNVINLAQRLRNENQLIGMNMMGTLPMIVGSLKLIIDMVLLMMTFMQNVQI